MLYMIHACKGREWYVNRFLVPSMLNQGIPRDNIKVWMDYEQKGNLTSTMESFAECGKSNGTTWHLQDDVILSEDFYERAELQDQEKVVCGFCSEAFGPNINKIGPVRPYEMWWSFPCIQIPNYLAGECSEWFYECASKDDKKCYSERVGKGKSDDWFWRRFMILRYPRFDVINLNPNLVDHIDYLIGGSVINSTRSKDTRSAWFRDIDLVAKLESELKDENLRRAHLF